MTRRSYEGVGDAPRPDEGGMRRLARAINGLLQGKSNNVIDVTLADSATTTTITDRRIGAESHLSFTALTANAAAIQASIWVSARGQFTATVTHTSTANTDQNFTVSITG